MAVLEKRQVYIRGSNRAVSVWYLGVGTGGREMGWKKEGEKEEEGSESVKDHSKGCGCREAIHGIWHV